MLKRNKTGFAISIDALLATIITLGILTFISLGSMTQETVVTEQSINLRQTADDAFAALGNNGVFAKYLADPELTQTTLANQANQDRPGIYYEAKKMLPKNTGLRIAVSEYQPEDDDLAQCKLTKDFEDCFGNAALATEQYPSSNPVDKEIIHGKKIVIMKETSLGEETPEGRTCVPEQMLEFEKKEETEKALLQGETELDIETSVEVTDPVTGNPLTGISCDETAKVTVKARNTTRDPIAIMLAMDKSGSMKTYDMLVQEANGTFNEGTCEDQPIWVEGRFNNALQFDGIRNYVECGQAPIFSIEGEITISMWVKIDNPEYNNWMHFLEKNYYMMYHPYANRLLIYGGGSDYAEAANVNLDTGWHHIAGVINNTTGTLYVDGVNRTTNSSVTALANSSTYLRIGYGYYFGGIMDEVRIHNRALNSNEVQQLVNGTNVPEGLVGYWRFDETEKFVAYDSSGNGNNCALQYWLHVYPEDQWVPGHTGNALEFDGYNDYVSVPDSPTLDLTTFTVAAWVYPEEVKNNYQPLIVKENNTGGERNYGLLIRPNEMRLHFSFYHSNCSSSRSYDSVGSINLNQWNYVTMTYNGSQFILYINGNPDRTVNITSTVCQNSYPVKIGGEISAYTNFNGLMDDARIYNRQLSQAEISTLYSGGSMPVGLVGHWLFDESNGDTAFDSADSHDGTLHNWITEVTGECQYQAGEPKQVTTNCPASKAYFDSFTGKQEIASYDISHIYPCINTLPNPSDSLDFIASSTPYVGVCTEPTAYMRLWVRRPDGYVEYNQTSSTYYEDVYTITNGNYDAIVWSDAPIDYDVWLRQTIRGRANNIALGGGTHDGIYSAGGLGGDPPPTACSNYGNWQHLTDFDFSDYNRLYYVLWYFYYDAYQSAGGQCGTPAFMIKYNSEGKEWVQGKVGNALDFGANVRKNYVEVPANPSLDVQNFSISAWFKTGADAIYSSLWRYPKIFGRTNDSGGDELFVGFYYSYEDIISVYLDGSRYDFDGDIDLWDMQWHHLSVTYNGLTLKTYVDGSLYGNVVSTFKALDFGNGSAFIGTSLNNGLPYYYWYGQIDEVRLYDRAITPDEVNQIYSAESGGSKSNISSGLAGFWALDESSGFVAADSSGNGNEGTAHLDQNWTILNCGSGDSSNCYIYQLNEGTYGPYLEPGNYEIWGWSDVGTEADARLYQAYQHWGQVYGSGKNQHLDNGTCNGEQCQMESIPATGAYTNCPNLTGYKMASLPGIGSSRLIDTFNVSSSLTGLKADVTFDYTAGSEATCGGAAMSFQNQIDGSNDPNWYYIFSNKGSSVSTSIWPTNTTTRSLYVNDWPTDDSRYTYWAWSDAPPIAQGDYNILGWAEKNAAYSIRWNLQRIDAAKNAAFTFIDNAAWKADDEIGLVSFSTETTLDQGLTTDREAVNAGLGSLETGGETAIADAIDMAAAELVDNADSHAGRFIILLTDGKANVCRGGVPCTESQAITDAIVAADDARNQEITVYVIGFADETLIGEYEEYLKGIALDKDDESYSEDCADGTLQFCGKYYYAADEETLQEMYRLIALEIVRTIGSMDIQIPVPEGMELSNYGGDTCGIWDDNIGGFVETESCNGECSDGNETCDGGETLYLKGRGIGGFSGDFWWAAQFDAVLPCNASNCSQNYVLFPPIGTGLVESSTHEMVDWDYTEGENVICEEDESTNCFKKIPLKYSDLNAAFTYGLLVTGNGSAIINLEVSNNGYNNIPIERVLADGLEVEFYKKDKSNKLELEWGGSGVYLGDEGNEPLTLQSSLDGKLLIAMPSVSDQDGTCSWLDGLCQGLFEQSDWKIRVDGLRLKGCPDNDCTGTIIAEINANGNVNECPFHNEGRLFCNAGRFRLFTIDYYMWVE